MGSLKLSPPFSAFNRIWSIDQSISTNWLQKSLQYDARVVIYNLRGFIRLATAQGSSEMSNAVKRIPLIILKRQIFNDLKLQYCCWLCNKKSSSLAEKINKLKQSGRWTISLLSSIFLLIYQMLRGTNVLHRIRANLVQCCLVIIYTHTVNGQLSFWIPATGYCMDNISYFIIKWECCLKRLLK